MKKSTLIEYLKKFTPKDIREFGEFVHSPFFNKNQGVIKLYEYMRKQYPAFDASKLSKKDVFKKLFPKVAYSESFMKTLIHNLQKLVDDYLEYIGMKKHQFRGKIFLMTWLNEKELNRPIERKMKELKKELERVRVRDEDYYYDKANIEIQYFHYLTRATIHKREKFYKSGFSDEIAKDLTVYYLNYALQYYLFTYLVKRQYDFVSEPGLIEDIIRILKPGDFEDVPLINLYYNLLMMYLKEDDVSYFYKAKSITGDYADQLGDFNIKNAHINLCNYCLYKMDKDRKFVRELFELIKFSLNKKLYIFPGLKEMDEVFYNMAVSIALRLKEYEWARKFIEEYKNELNQDYREPTYYYSFALYEFTVKNFEKSLELVSRVKYTEVYQRTKLRVLACALYYELKMEEQFLSLIDSFRHFLSHDKLLAPEIKQIFINFEKYTKALNDVRNKNDVQELKTLKKKIQAETALYNKEWILAKIHELEK